VFIETADRMLYWHNFQHRGLSDRTIWGPRRLLNRFSGTALVHDGKADQFDPWSGARLRFQKLKPIATISSVLSVRGLPKGPLTVSFK
jgi:hypothetical protein